MTKHSAHRSATASLIALLLIVLGAIPAGAQPAPDSQGVEQANLIGVATTQGVDWHFVPSYANSGSPVELIELAAGQPMSVVWEIPAAEDDEITSVSWLLTDQPAGGDLRVVGPDGATILGQSGTTSWRGASGFATQWSATAAGSYEITLTTSLTRGKRVIAGDPIVIRVEVLESRGPQDRPAGQSDDPAPASVSKDVIENVHADMVSAYLDSGRLVLASKADVAAGLGTRYDPATTLFHLSDASRRTVPSSPLFSFLGPAGSTIWMAPQTQNPAIIWPGFSTEDPNLRGKAQSFQVRMVSVDGPGEVDVYMTDAEVERIFSTQADLPAWTIGVPQHTHMTWAFTAAGTYTLTFEMTGQVDGATRTARNVYTMVVGELAAHTKTTRVSLSSDRSTILPDEGALLTATVSPSSAVGTVQVRNLTTGVIVGHSPVVNGTAQFLADSLVGGQHELAAEFVPTYSNDFTTSRSSSIVINMRGQSFDRPDDEDTQPIVRSDLAGLIAGQGVSIEGGGNVTTGANLRLVIDADIVPGEWVSAWIVGSQWLGWLATDASASTTFQVPAGLRQGATYEVAIRTTDGRVLGFDTFSTAADGASPPDGGVSPTPTTPPDDSGTPTHAPQVCRPTVTLDYGHIDAFNVSASSTRAVLELKEDVTGYQVLRQPESVLLRVKESAYRSSIPAGTPGSPSGYVLPLAQSSSLVWPGWDTNRTSASGYSDVTIYISNVSGPGAVRLFTRGPFGDIQSLLNSGGYTLPGAIREAIPAHTHAEWVFSQKGIYILTAYAIATNPDTGASLRTGSHRYVFQVGEVEMGDVFCTVRPSASSAAEALRVQAAVQDAAIEAAEEALEEAAAEQAEDLAAGGAESDLPQSDGETDSAAGGAGSIVNDLSATSIGLIVGGGIAVIAGIVGGTFAYVRRLGRQ